MNKKLVPDPPAKIIPFIRILNLLLSLKNFPYPFITLSIPYIIPFSLHPPGMYRRPSAEPCRKASRCVRSASIPQSFLDPSDIFFPIQIERRYRQIPLRFFWLFLVGCNLLALIHRNDRCFPLFYRIRFLMTHHAGCSLFFSKVPFQVKCCWIELL